MKNFLDLYLCAAGVESVDVNIQLLSVFILLWHVNRIIFVDLFVNVLAYVLFLLAAVTDLNSADELFEHSYFCYLCCEDNSNYKRNSRDLFSARCF